MSDFHYSRAKLLRLKDADTAVLEIDVGFGFRFVGTFRLLGVNAPELNTPEGRAAKEWVAEWFATAGETLHIDSYKSDSFGRWLATIWSEKNSVPLNEALIIAGHGVRYRGLSSPAADGGGGGTHNIGVG